MIWIDDRVGSKELAAYLPKNKAALKRLSFGDVMWMGNGPDDTIIPVGVERKTIIDLLSSITTGRLSGYQLPGLVRVYQVVYLIVEGIWMAAPDSGLLTIKGPKWFTPDTGGRRFMWRDVILYLTTLETLAGIKIRQTSNPTQTAEVILALHFWWTNKRFEEHRAHIANYTEGPLIARLHHQPSLVERVASVLPGIGPKRAEEIAKCFPTVADMVNSDEKKWLEILGKKTGAKAWASLR